MSAINAALLAVVASLRNQGFTQAQIDAAYAAVAPATVSGFVKDTTGKGIAGVTVYLDTNNNGAIDAGELVQTTAGDGSFTFANVPVGPAYILRQSVPVGYAQLTPTTPAGDAPYGFHLTVTSGSAISGETFVNQLIAVTTSTQSAPPAQGYSMGWNVGNQVAALTDTGASLAQMQADTKPLGGIQYMRLWQTGSLATPPTASQFTQTLKYAAAGIKVIAVYNTQNSPTRCTMPTTAQIQAYFNALPTAAASGIWAWELVNEADYTGYFTGTVNDLANLFSIAGPILHAKGYKVIGTNALYGNGWYSTLASLGALKFVDYIGKHAYDGTAAAALAEYDSLIALAAANDVGVCCTEVGLHGGNPTELAALWEGLKQRNGIFLFFCLYTIATAPGGQLSPYASPGVQNAAEYNAVLPVLG